MPKTKEPEFEVPRIGIKIRREGEWLRFDIGNVKFRTKAIGNQEYDLVVIEQFITKAAKQAYNNIIQAEQVKIDLKAAMDWDKKHDKDTKA